MHNCEGATASARQRARSRCARPARPINRSRKKPRSPPEMLGNTVDRICDVGVAGIHRLLAQRERLASARVVIVVAAWKARCRASSPEWSSVPVIGVPTSIGYGASFGGVAALLGMLNSCANGVSVVNIDNGYGAGCIASMINHL